MVGDPVLLITNRFSRCHGSGWPEGNTCVSVLGHVGMDQAGHMAV